MRRRSWPTALLMLLGGCQNSPWWCDSCADLPPGAMPAPVGSYNGQWQQTQAARADEDFRVFYQYEWLGESSHLSPFGQRHLERLPTRFAAPDGPLIVEASGDEARDQARVQALQASLTRLDPAWAECPVQVGRSDAEPLYGFESARISSGFVGRGGGGGGGGGGGQGTGGQGGFGGGIGGAAGFGGGSR